MRQQGMPPHVQEGMEKMLKVMQDCNFSVIETEGCLSSMWLAVMVGLRMPPQTLKTIFDAMLEDYQSMLECVKPKS